MSVPGGLVGSPLFRRVMVWNAGDERSGEIMRQIWTLTPHVIDVFTGSRADDLEREREILHWCHDQLGEPAWGFSEPPRPGRWQRGSATVFGWTWFGFAELADQLAFETRWPSPCCK